METFLLLLIAAVINISSCGFIHPMNSEEYSLITRLVQNDGKMDIPICERTRSEKSAYVKFWRLKSKLSLDAKGRLLFEGRLVLQKNEMKRAVSKTFVESKSGGYKKIRTHAADGYAGMSNREILKVTQNNIKFKRFTAKFTNKAIPKAITASNIQDVHQIDLIDMTRMKVQYNGKTYSYILSLMDVFSRFHWMKPLERKTAKAVRRELKRIYDLHGIPLRLQSDNGKEFLGAVKKYCQLKKITFIKSRPFNPKAQGKVERSHRSFRKKLLFDLINQKRSGVNWVKNINQYAKCLNNEKREELGWKSAFEVYFGRKSNELVNIGKEIENADSIEEQVLPPSEREIEEALHRTSFIRESAKNATDRINKRTENYFKARFKCPVFQKNDKVLIRYGKRGKLSPKRYHVLVGKILKVGKNENNYKVKFRSPDNNKISSQWFSIEDIADFKKCGKFSIPVDKKVQDKVPKKANKRPNPLNSIEQQGFEIVHNPRGDGNCQFAALAYAFRSFGIHRTASILRREIVSYLEENPLDRQGFPLELYLGVPYSDYISNMYSEGTFGDELTLRAAAEIFNVEFMVISSLGEDARVVISPRNFVPRGRIILGHFAEGNGDHYVSLRVNLSNDVDFNSERTETNNQPKNENLKNEPGKKCSQQNKEGNEEDLGLGNNNYHQADYNSDYTETNDRTKNKNLNEDPEKVCSQQNKEGNEEKLGRPKRSRKKPVRFRHSIGSPSCSNQPQRSQRRLSPFEKIPAEVLENILFQAISTGEYSSRIVTYNNLKQVCQFWKLVLEGQRAFTFLPQVHIGNNNILGDSVTKRSGKKTVSMQRIVRNAGSFSGLVMELKSIINNENWNSAWVVLTLLGYGWYVVENVFWKTKKH